MSGFYEGLKKRFGSHKEDLSMERTLRDEGVVIIADKRLKEKLEGIRLLFTELQTEIAEKENPLKYVDLLHGRLRKLNLAIQALGAPSYRGGSNPQLGRVLGGWVKWNKLSEYCIQMIRLQIISLMYPEDRNIHQKKLTLTAIKERMKDLSGLTSMDIWSLVKRLETSLNAHPFADGQLVLARSYFDQDVLPSHSMVIQSIGTPKGGRVTLEGLLDLKNEKGK